MARSELDSGQATVAFESKAIRAQVQITMAIDCGDVASASLNSSDAFSKAVTIADCLEAKQRAIRRCAALPGRRYPQVSPDVAVRSDAYERGGDFPGQ